MKYSNEIHDMAYNMFCECIGSTDIKVNGIPKSEFINDTTWFWYYYQNAIIKLRKMKINKIR